MESLLSIVQMPSGVPVATVAIGNASNAGLLAVRMLTIQDPEQRRRMTTYCESLSRSSRESGVNSRSERSASGNNPHEEHGDRK